MAFDPYSIPPPRGWSPNVRPDQQIIPPPIGSSPVGQPLSSPQGWSPQGWSSQDWSSQDWSPQVEPAQLMSSNSSSSSTSLPPANPFDPGYVSRYSNPYPISPPIGSTPPKFTLPPPRGWTAPVELDPALLHPPKNYSPPSV